MIGSKLVPHETMNYIILRFYVRSGKQKSIHYGSLTFHCCEGQQRFAIILLVR